MYQRRWYIRIRWCSRAVGDTLPRLRCEPPYIRFLMQTKPAPYPEYPHRKKNTQFPRHPISHWYFPYKSPIRPLCVRTNSDERVQTNGHLSCKIMLGRMHITTHGRRSCRLHSSLKPVYKSVQEPPLQAQISSASKPVH